MVRKGNVLIISGGTIDGDWLKEWLCHNEIGYCIAADKGLETAYRYNIPVDYILGDYDSIDRNVLDAYRDNTDMVTYNPEKDYTDTHLALKKGIEVIKTTGYIDDICLYVAGATGTRLDHTLNNIYVLSEALQAGVKAFMIDKYNKIYIEDKTFIINKKSQYGDFVSFIPMTEEVRLSISGMKYNLDNFLLNQGSSICQSNEITEKEAVISIVKGRLIVIESRD